ncbi:hypothetical protein ACK280_26205 [Mycobacterium sherrisii]|uniref:hypothetical protein n=1 Tax=Mycobacterium sherrisii TaxID=243061 RepID=UPI0039759F92
MEGIEDVFAILDPEGHTVRALAALAHAKGIADLLSATLVAHRSVTDVTLTLDALRRGLAWRNKLRDTLRRDA